MERRNSGRPDREVHVSLETSRAGEQCLSDSYEHRGGKGVFHPVGFELFARMRKFFEPVDIISVTRHNKTLEMGNYRKAAEEGNFFLRGFNYLFIARKVEVKQ